MGAWRQQGGGVWGQGGGGHGRTSRVRPPSQGPRVSVQQEVSSEASE